MSVGIVGTGVSGLHLALRLHQLGIDAVLYAARGPDEIRNGPPVNFVTRFGSTRAREEALGMTQWASSTYDNPWMHMTMEGPEPLSFTARLPRPASSVDFRLYLATLLEELPRRGVTAVHRPIDEASHLAEVAEHHELLVVAAGRRALVETFPRIPARSPYSSPRRHLAGGLFRGVAPPDPPGMTMHMVAGAGEVHAPTFHSFDGRVTAILIEAIPGGPFAAVTGDDRGETPDEFARSVLDLITAHTPSLRARIDGREFALTRPVDRLRGSVVPEVRHSWTEPVAGRHALAIGDAWIANDPLTAQGANLGSAQAFQLADALTATTGPYDGAFCRRMADQLWTAAQPVVDWTNMFIGEPPPQMATLLNAAATDQQVADAFVANLDQPDAMWQSIRSPEDTANFIRRARTVGSRT